LLKLSFIKSEKKLKDIHRKHDSLKGNMKRGTVIKDIY
jgi:hypothetical protein